MNLATAIHLAAGRLHDALNEDDAIRGGKTPFDLCREALTILDEALLASPFRALSLESVREEALREAADELERAFAECDTLNLLHGAARVRALQHAPARVAEGECCCAVHNPNYGRCLQCPIHGAPPPESPAKEQPGEQKLGQGWIPVSERLPEGSTEVLTINKHGIRQVHFSEQLIKDTDGYFTYWMLLLPLPERP